MYHPSGLVGVGVGSRGETGGGDLGLLLLLGVFGVFGVFGALSCSRLR